MFSRMTEQENNIQSRKNALVAYLLSHIINIKHIEKVDNTKINRLIYLLWLEYAQLYPENTIPQTSPMRILEFYNYELGPVELSVSDNLDEIKRTLTTVGIPRFKEIGFNSSEQINILNACSFIRRRCMHLSAQQLTDFITGNLPISWNRPRYNKIEFHQNANFEREMRIYKKARKKLKSPTAKEK